MQRENKSMTGKKEHKKKAPPQTFAQWAAEQLKRVQTPVKKGGKG